ncbi:hypothetical protein ILUMI_19629 [Ignelater luminosus]|uniref:Uncharacterized protein n=1 Tax=Ignelater luminosus TaxID=2038154 RepID=A0A8K0G5B0_IGNLU|nr:hypothetical protein ILUMI_19629 [Ignelater luminosus]
MIDYIVTNRLIRPKQVVDVRSYTSANIGSEHYLVLGKFRFRQEPDEKSKTSQATPEEGLKTESLGDQATKWLYQRRLEEKTRINCIKEADRIELSWKKIKTNMLEAACKAVGTLKNAIINQPNDERLGLSKTSKISAVKRK